MSSEHLSRLLRYPEPWLKHKLLSPELVAIQGPQAHREYGEATPEGGTEHWRYAAFNYWFARELNAEELEHLLEAAIADPDPPMAGNALKSAAAHPLCTRAMVEAAKRCASSSEYYYVGPAELERLFLERGQHSGNAP
jgi:hypothetical protein